METVWIVGASAVVVSIVLVLRSFQKFRKRSVAAALTCEAIRPLVASCEMEVGGDLEQKSIPAAVWLHPYVIGWIMLMATIASKEVFGERPSYMDRHETTAMAYERLFGIDVLQFRTGRKNALQRDSRNLMYKRDAQYAAIVVGVGNESQEFQSSPEVRQAMEEARKQPPMLSTASLASTAASLLAEKYFVLQVVVMASQLERVRDDDVYRLEDYLQMITPPLERLPQALAAMERTEIG